MSMAGETMPLLLLMAIFFSAVDAAPASSLIKHPFSATSSMKGAYWPSWFSSTFPPSSINTTYFTHIYYAFVAPDPSTFKITINQKDARLLANFAATLHGKNPPVKALLSIGGGNSNSTAFANMASTAANRAAFIDSTIAAARKYGLDGFDLDWEFPKNQKEMEDLGLLFAEWRSKFGKVAAATGRRRLLLTAAVYFAAKFILADNRAFPAVSMGANLDWVNVMNYDYHGSWDTSATGAHAALYDPKSNVSTSFGLQSWVDAGVPSRKVVMGLPLYGKTWELKDAAVHGVGAAAVGVGPGEEGVLFFKDVVDYNVKNNATVVYDRTTVSVYSYAGKSWIGYDDATSVTRKIEHARGMKLGGYFFWALSYDKDWIISKQASKAWSH